MMLPSEFLGRYGRVTVHTFPIDTGTIHQIEPDENRYLLAFWHTDTAVFIIPRDTDPFPSTGENLTIGSRPIILTHALHGSLVNIGWQIGVSGISPPGNVTVCIGRMSEPRKRTKEKPNAKNT